MKRLLIAVFLIPICAISQDTIPLSKIERMMDLLGTSERFEMLIDPLLEEQREYFKGNEELFERFKLKVHDGGGKMLLDMLAPIYQRHLNEVEVDALIAFYQTETGQSLLTKLPKISLEAAAVGQEWGLKIADMIQQDLDREREINFEKPTVNCDRFKHGNYYYHVQDGTRVDVQRKDGVQTEMINGEMVFTAKYEWISDCRYKLWAIDQSTGEFEDIPLQVTIYDFNENSYRFVSHKEGVDLYDESQMFFK